MMRRLVLWLAWASLAMAPSLASAQARALVWPILPATPPPRPAAFAAPAVGQLRLAARWDTFLYVGSASRYDPQVTQLANEMTLSLDFGSVLVRGTLPFAYANVPADVDTIDRSEVGNTSLEGYANVALDTTQRLLIGGGVVLPTGTDPNCLSGCTHQGMNVRTRAWQISFRDGALWADETVTVAPAIDYTLGIPWFLLHVVGSVPIFFPIDPDVGGPQPAARGAVDVMPSLDLSVALRIEHWIAIGASFLGWVIATVNENTPTRPDVMVGTLVLPSTRVGQYAQAAITGFVRTDPELDAPIGGEIEVIYDLHSWHTNAPFEAYLGQTWSIHASIHGRFDVAL